MNALFWANHTLSGQTVAGSFRCAARRSVVQNGSVVQSPGHRDWDGTLGLGRDTGTGTGHRDSDGTTGTGTGHEVARVGRATFFLLEVDPQKWLTQSPRTAALRGALGRTLQKGPEFGTNGGSPIQVWVRFANKKGDPI
jgi:hypothetical protein